VVAFTYAWWRAENGRSETVQLMPKLAEFWTWWEAHAVDATGWAALWWAWGTVILGLLVAGGRPNWLRLPTRTIEKLHRTTSLTVIGFTLLHILLMTQSWLRHHDYGYSVPKAFAVDFVPLVWGNPLIWGSDEAERTGFWAIGVAGTGAFWLSIVLGLSYYFRHLIGVRVWRFAHRFSILVYVLAVWHTFLYGPNVWYTGYQRTLLWVMQLPVAYLVLARLLSPIRRSDRLPLQPRALLQRFSPMTASRLGVRLVAVASLVVLALILVLNRTGGHQRPDRYPTAEEIRLDNADG
jgi:sulfoxide reductase heme-binding subunit YedZ